MSDRVLPVLEVDVDGGATVERFAHAVGGGLGQGGFTLAVQGDDAAVDALGDQGVRDGARTTVRQAEVIGGRARGVGVADDQDARRGAMVSI